MKITWAGTTYIQLETLNVLQFVATLASSFFSNTVKCTANHLVDNIKALDTMERNQFGQMIFCNTNPTQSDPCILSTVHCLYNI